MVTASKQNPSLQDVFNAQPGRMSDFIDYSRTPPYAYRPKPNLALNPDLTMSPTASNVEAMGQNYFDKKAIALGGHVGLATTATPITPTTTPLGPSAWQRAWNASTIRVRRC